MFPFGTRGTQRGGWSLLGGPVVNELSDALLAVVVEAREDLGVTKVFLTNGAGDLLFKLLQTLLHGIRSFCHRYYSLRKRNTAMKRQKGVGKASDQLRPHSCSAHVQNIPTSLVPRSPERIPEVFIS